MIDLTSETRNAFLRILECDGITEADAVSITNLMDAGSDKIEQQSTALAKAQARIAELEGALGPFADVEMPEWVMPLDRYSMPAESFRRARAAIKGEG